MQKNMKKVLTLCTATAFLVGCASTTIYPGQKGSYSLVTTSSEQGYAEKDAKKKAEKYCADMGKSLAVIDHNTSYHGADKNTVAIMGLASAIIAPGAGNVAKSNQDYQVDMKFRCE